MTVQQLVVLLYDVFYPFFVATVVIRWIEDDGESVNLPRHWRLQVFSLLFLPAAGVNLLASGWDWQAWLRDYLGGLIVTGILFNIGMGISTLPLLRAIRRFMRRQERELIQKTQAIIDKEQHHDRLRTRNLAS